jgi:mannose-6-phosphate isomerase-like protein (cupin superfamily)
MHISPHQGRSYWLATDLHTFKVVGADTEGRFTLTEVTARPEFGPPPHIHHRQDETFYVIEGTLEIVYQGKTFTAGPGSVVHLEKGRVHSHRAVGNGPARALAIYTPGGLDQFIAEAGIPATDRSAVPQPPSMPELERIVAIATKYGIEVPPPPAG